MSLPNAKKNSSQETGNEYKPKDEDGKWNSKKYNRKEQS